VLDYRAALPGFREIIDAEHEVIFRTAAAEE
jgi:hypothetical protein